MKIQRLIQILNLIINLSNSNFYDFCYYDASRLTKSSGAGKILDFGKRSNTTGYKRKITYDDVAGLTEEKEELKEIVEFLKTEEVSQWGTNSKRIAFSGLQEQVKLFLQELLQERLRFHFIQLVVLTLLKCM